MNNNIRTSYYEEQTESYAEIYTKIMIGIVLGLTSVLAIAGFMVITMM